MHKVQQSYKAKNLSSLRSSTNSHESRKVTRSEYEYLKLGQVMKRLYGLGFKVKWNKPLSKSIYREIRENVSKEEISSRDLYNAIGYHVRSINYLLKMRPGHGRFNIFGKKVDEVTPAESKNALGQLLSYHAEFMRKRKLKSSKTAGTKKTGKAEKR